MSLRSARKRCENSYNGIRCQIHCSDNRIIVFNKSTEDITDKYPEIVGYVSIFINKSKEKNKKEIKSFILDAVFLPFDKKNDRSLNVQELTFFSREAMQPNSKINCKICIFCFDLLFFNGEIIINKSLRDRRKVMTSAFCETMSIRFAKFIELEKKVFVLYPGESNSWSIVKDGVRYICLGSLYKDKQINPNYKSLRFRVTGDNIIYKFE